MKGMRRGPSFIARVMGRFLNVYALIGEGREKVWRDYSIAERLALHSVVAFPRTGYVMERFQPPHWLGKKVLYAPRLKHHEVSASAIRNGQVPDSLLPKFVPEAVARYISERNPWAQDSG